MTLIAVLLLLAIVQAVFLLLLFFLLASNRAVASRRRRATRRARARVAGPLSDWLAGGKSVGAFCVALSTLAERDAVAELLNAAARIPPEHLNELAAEARHDRWVVHVLRRMHSRFWWRRLTAARVLGVVGIPADRENLLALLNDHHPVVQAVASAALPRVADAALTAAVVDALPDQPPIVRSAQHRMLVQLPRFTVPALVERLDAGAAPESLRAWIALADAFGTAELLERVRVLGAHADPLVRLAVASALRKYFAPSGLDALRALLADPDWRVRARAAQSLGIVGAAGAVEDLSRSLHDGNWWVRFRSGLTLAQLGEPGRQVLRQARSQTDQPAADMAAMITGLSAGGLVELSES